MQFISPAVAFFLAFALTPFLRRLATVRHPDQPNHRKNHGQAILLGASLFICPSGLPPGRSSFPEEGGRFWGFSPGSSLVVAIGLYDIYEAFLTAKFAGQFAAALILLAFNIKIEFITFPSEYGLSGGLYRSSHPGLDCMLPMPLIIDGWTGCMGFRLLPR